MSQIRIWHNRPHTNENHSMQLCSKAFHSCPNKKSKLHDDNLMTMNVVKSDSIVYLMYDAVIQIYWLCSAADMACAILQSLLL